MNIEIDSHEVTAALARLSQSVADMRPAFEGIGAALEQNILLGFRDGQDPWGNPWSALAQIRRNNRDPRISDKPLNNTRQHIYNKITHNADSHGVEIGMNEDKPIGITHQFGSTNNNIPARPFLPIHGDHADLPDSWEREVLDIIARHLEQSL